MFIHLISETTIMNDKPGEKHMVGKAIWVHVSNAIQHTREYSKCKNETKTILKL